MTIPKSLERQVGGDHYKKYAVQPLEFAEKLGLSPIIFCAFKYVCRYKDKAKPVEDLRKALHCVDIFAECGKEKTIYSTVDYLNVFLEQFDKDHATTLYSLLQLQGDKDKADRTKIFIEKLLQEELKSA